MIGTLIFCKVFALQTFFSRKQALYKNILLTFIELKTKWFQGVASETILSTV